MSKKHTKVKAPAKRQKPERDNKMDPFFEVVAKVYGVPAHGISALGKQPYLNKDGRLYLLQELRKGDKEVRAIRVEFIQYSKSLSEAAIVKKIIVFRNDTEVEAIGEASQENVEVSNVKKTLNMVAETRALNRAIWVAIGADVMTRVQTNLEDESLKISPEDRDRIMEAGRVSYEEMERPEEPKTMHGSSKLYESTSKRIDEISDDEAALRKALEKVPTMPLSPDQKLAITDKIKGLLSNILPSIDVGAAPAKKVVKKAVKKKKK